MSTVYVICGFHSFAVQDLASSPWGPKHCEVNVAKSRTKQKAEAVTSQLSKNVPFLSTTHPSVLEVSWSSLRNQKEPQQQSYTGQMYC